MNNTEYENLSKEQIFAYYEQVCIDLDFAENMLSQKESEINELESDIDYWRGKYEERGDD